MKVPCVRSIAARSPGAAWQLLTSDERRRLLAYIERAQAWETSPSLDAACYSTNKYWKGELSAMVSAVR
jgi:hypothetical protein